MGNSGGLGIGCMVEGLRNHGLLLGFGDSSLEGRVWEYFVWELVFCKLLACNGLHASFGSALHLSSSAWVVIRLFEILSAIFFMM